MRLGALFAGVLLLGLAAFILWPTPEPTEPPAVTEETTSEPEPEPFARTYEIGRSVQDRTIEVYEFGNGETELLFVGGIHGGYEWNSVSLANEMINYFSTNPNRVPDSIRVSIIPNLNPDGYALAVDENGFVLDFENRLAEGRFNANGVDLNRNFDCKWAPESTWRGQTVSAGTGPFSEPEAAALRDYVNETDPNAVVFWHSQANNVYASECHEGLLPETLTIMQLYADEAGYGAVPSFDAYPITGDAEGWLASIGIPAITVELKSYKSTEWDKNLAAVEAMISYYTTDS